MNRAFVKLFTIALLLLLIISCGQVLITGRRQFLLFSQGEIASLSNQTYSQILKESKLSTNQNYINRVREVGNRLTMAVDKYVKANGMERALEGINWHFDVVASPQVNAFCLPNGNIVFYEGIMDVATTPDMIAVVMGHEIAHALAKHGNERMSQEMVVGTVGQALSAFIGTESQKSQAMFQLAFGVGSQLGVLLPYSRKHEYEADKLGLIIMAMAGYNINEAPLFWERMSDGKGSSMDFFSTHPADQKRIKEIKALLPEAAKYATIYR